MQKIDIFSIFFIIILQFSITLTFSNNYPYEQAFRFDNNVVYEKYGKKIGLTENIKNHREFLNGASGDSIEYFKIAIDDIDSSRVPYTYRFVYPKIMGLFAKTLVSEPKESKYYKDELFRMVSFLVRFSNLLSNILLLLIPLICFKNLFLDNNKLSIAPFILVMNVINCGNLKNSPFFSVDQLNMVFFALAAMFFYKKKIFLYLVITCVSILIKEISIVLMIPIIFLIIKENKLNLLTKTVIFLIPLIIFFSIRLYFSDGNIGLNIGKNGSIINFKDIFSDGLSSFYYFSEIHGKSLKSFLLFSISVVISIGFICLIVFYLKFRFNQNSEYFLVTNLILISVIFAVFFHASGVVRTVQIVTPFLVFYSLSVLQELSLKDKSYKTD